MPQSTNQTTEHSRRHPSPDAQRVTLFERVDKPDNIRDTPTVDELLSAFKSGTYADAIADLRAEPDKEKRKAIKRGMLPAVTFSGTFGRRSSDALGVHSGFVCLDFDDVEDPAEMRDRLTAESRHVRAAFVSPSSTGVKALVPILVVDADTGEERLPLDDAEHKQAWSAVAARFPLATLDSGCKDVSRLCYVSHDPELAENESAVPVSHVLRSPERERHSTNAQTPNDYRPSGVTRDDPWPPPTVREMLRRVRMDRPPYDEWVKLIAATLDAVQGDHTTAAALLRERWPEESEGEYEAKLRAPLGKVTRGTLFMYAEQGGFRFDGGRAAHDRSASAVRPESPPLSVYGEEGDAPAGSEDGGSGEHLGQSEPRDAAPLLTGAPSIPAAVYDRLPRLFAAGCSHFSTWYERDVFLTGMLGTLSAALPHVRFHYDRTYHSPHLMLFVIAEAGRGKGAMSHAFKLLEPIADAKAERTKDNRAVWEAKRRAYEKKGASELVEAPGAEPGELLIIAGADTTLPALVQALAANPEGLLTAATEADQVSGAMRKEHGGFSPLWRAAFHHERYTKTTKSEGTVSVAAPRLAVCVSGTEAQFLPLVESVENGLFSRFGVYRFRAPLAYRSRLHASRNNDFDDFLTDTSGHVQHVYNALERRSEPLYIDVPPDLWEDVVDAGFQALFDRLFTGAGRAPEGFAANVFRGAVTAFRIASILTVYRLAESGADLSRAASVEADRESVEAGTALALVYVEHAMRQALHLTPALGKLPNMEGAGRMTGEQLDFLAALPETFTTGDALALVQPERSPSARSVERWLSKWTDPGGPLRRRGQGAYEKRATETRGGSGGTGGFLLGVAETHDLSRQPPVAEVAEPPRTAKPPPNRQLQVADENGLYGSVKPQTAKPPLPPQGDGLPAASVFIPDGFEDNGGDFFNLD